jgi:hypothetical protein
MIPAFEEDGWVSQVPPFRWASDNPKIIIACLHIVTSVLSVAGFATAILFAHVDGGKSKGFVAVWSFLSAAGVSAVAAITFRFFVIPQAIFYTLGCMVASSNTLLVCFAIFLPATTNVERAIAALSFILVSLMLVEAALVFVFRGRLSMSKSSFESIDGESKHDGI